MIHFLNTTGNNEMIANTVSTDIDINEICPVAVVNSYNVVPALMNKNDGGATPIEEINLTL